MIEAYRRVRPSGRIPWAIILRHRPPAATADTGTDDDATTAEDDALLDRMFGCWRTPTP